MVVLSRILCQVNELQQQLTLLSLQFFFFFFFNFFYKLIYKTTSSQLYYKYLQNLQRLHPRYAQSAKTTELDLRNTARKTLDNNAMLALSLKPSAFVC